MYNALGEMMAASYPDGSETVTHVFPRDIYRRRTEIFDDRPSVGWEGVDEWFARIAGQQVLMGGSTSWLVHKDVIGTTTMVTDQTGAASGDVLFDPWGNRIGGGGSNGDVFGGLGMEMNQVLPPSATRYYNPGLDRWLTPDKLGGDIMNPQSLNRYAYADNNPATLNDPSGLDPDLDACSDFGYAISHAECQDPAATRCSEFLFDPNCSGWGIPIEGDHVYGGISGGGGALPRPARRPTAPGGRGRKWIYFPRRRCSLG